MINVSLPDVETQLRPRITVFGVGGAGGNAVNNMIRANLEGVDFVVANTDAQALQGSLATKRLQLGTTITRGLGAGSRPDVGRAAAEEQIEDILQHLEGANMVFITAGMGGGTGTGAAPVIARVAREQGILTVGVVTKPFHFEGAHRMRLAESGIAELQQYVDTLIIIPNQNLFRIANEKTTFADAFKMADDVLHSGVRGVTDLMVMPGLINLDFADIRSVMTEMGKAMMGTGEATGERRAIDAAEAAISNPLLDDVSMKGARGVLINITGGYDMTLFEVDEAANRIRDEVDPDANIIFGSTFDQNMEGRMRVSVVATGIDAALMAQSRPQAPQQTQAQAGNPASATFSVVTGGKKPVPQTAPTAAGNIGPVRPADYLANMQQAPMPPSQATGLMPQPVTTTATARALEMEAPLQTAPSAMQIAPSATAIQAGDDMARGEAMPAPSARDNREVLSRSDRAGASDTASPTNRATGPLRGERKDGLFIAPRPADAGPRQPVTHGDGYGPGPATGPVGQDEEPRRKPSLFARMTGLGAATRRFMEGHEIEQQQQPAPRPTVQAPSAPSAGSRPPQQPVQGTSQRLSVDPADRAKLSPAEEDALDIPAFLRRQAN